MLKKLLKQDVDDLDVPDPDDDETESDFMDRCTDQLMGDNDDLSEDDAIDACQMAWDDRAAPTEALSRKGETTFKTHAADVHGMEFVLSDESVDRMGDIISASGWDLASFNKNPIALFGHQSSFPIGKWSNVAAKDGQLRGHLELAPEGTSQRIDEIRRLIAAGILRAVSVGFRVLERKARKNDNGDYVGEHFLRQELLETSLVSVPANANALAVAKSLQISADTLDLVFAESGTDQTRSQHKSRLNRRVRQKSSNGLRFKT